MVKRSGSIIVLLVVTSMINGMENRSASAWLDHAMTSVAGAQPSGGGVVSTIEHELEVIGAAVEYTGASPSDARAYLYGMAGGASILAVKALFDYYMPFNHSAVDAHLQQQGQDVDTALKTAPMLTNIASKEYVDERLKILSGKLLEKGYVDTAIKTAKQEVIDALTGMVTTVTTRQDTADAAVKGVYKKMDELETSINRRVGAVETSVAKSIKDLAAIDIGLKALKLVVEGDTKDRTKFPGIVFAHDALANRVAGLENAKGVAEKAAAAASNNNNNNTTSRGGIMSVLRGKDRNTDAVHKGDNHSDTL